MDCTLLAKTMLVALENEGRMSTYQVLTHLVRRTLISPISGVMSKTDMSG